MTPTTLNTKRSLYDLRSRDKLILLGLLAGYTSEVDLTNFYNYHRPPLTGEYDSYHTSKSLCRWLFEAGLIENSDGRWRVIPDKYELASSLELWGVRLKDLVDRCQMPVQQSLFVKAWKDDQTDWGCKADPFFCLAREEILNQLKPWLNRRFNLTEEYSEEFSRVTSEILQLYGPD